MTTTPTTHATAALAKAAAPLLRTYDDCVSQSDALARLFNRDDLSEAATHVRTARIYLSEAAVMIETALADLRYQVASAHGLSLSDVPSVADMLASGERA